MDLLSAWQKWDADSPPYILKADANVLKSPKNKQYVVDQETPYTPNDKRLHLGLLPGPFMGDMLNASIYVLMFHPGLDSEDYDGDKDHDFRRAILANLKQESLEGVLPFTFLDPQFAWHGGFKYWNNRLGLAKLVKALAMGRGVSCEEARSELGKKLAVIHHVPYHNVSFNHQLDNAMRDLHSTRLAEEFVKETVVKRVRAKQAIAIVALRVKYWNQYLPKDLTEEQGLTRYDTTLARAASLNPNAPKSPGGRAILCHLGVDVQSKYK